MRRSVWPSALIVILFSCVLSFGQGVHTLQGKVVAPNGSAPAQPVRVSLTYSGRPIYETFTDLGGHFSFSGLSAGTYELTAEGDDTTFETTHVSAEVTAFGGAPQLFTQDIHLQPFQGKPPSRSGVVNAFVQNVPKAAAQALAQGQKLEQLGKRPEALAKMQEALRIFPAYFEAHLALGNHFVKEGLFSEAISELDRAREIYPNDERLYQSFGLIMIEQKKYRVALAVFREASRLNPTNPFNLFMSGIALVGQASSIDPAQSKAAEQDRIRTLDEAEHFLTKAYELSGKKLIAVHLQLARVYEDRGDRARAATELEQYLKEKPDAKNTNELQEAIRKLRSPPAK